MPPWDLVDRTRAFALAVLTFYRSKLQIAYEEADECVDWLEYMKDGRIQQDAALLQEAREIASILAVAVRTAGKNPTNQP